MDRKALAKALDRAAYRAEAVGLRGATPKQCWYLAGLAIAAGLDADALGFGPLDTTSGLTSREASRLIDDLLKGAMAA